jgi:predicted phage tail protein
VTDTGSGGLSNSIVELQAFDKSGNAVMTTFWTGQNFTAGQTLQFSYTWNSPASLAAGTYSVDIGVFDANWSHNYYWNGSAGSIMIGAPGPPSAPSGLTAIGGNAAVTLSWTATSGAASYSVYRGTAAGAEAVKPIATGITTTAFTNTGLKNGKKYFFRVRAVNSFGTSGLSNEAAGTPVPSAPAAPTGLTATAGNARVKLKWTANPGAKSYNVYRGTATGSEGVTPIATGITGVAHTFAGLANGQPYFFKVAAVNAGGSSPLSNEASATPVK